MSTSMGGMDPEMMERNALVLAAHGDLEKTRELVASRPELINEPGVGPAFGGERPLDAAAHTHNRAIAQALLDAGATHNIYSAVFMGEYDTVSEMLKADPALVKTPGVHDIPILGFRRRPLDGGNADRGRCGRQCDEPCALSDHAVARRGAARQCARGGNAAAQWRGHHGS